MALRHDEDVADSERVKGPFTEAEGLAVSNCGLVSCSAGETSTDHLYGGFVVNAVLEQRAVSCSVPKDQTERACWIYSKCDRLCSPNGGSFWLVSIPKSVMEVSDSCFCNRADLHSVLVCSSSNLERIGVGAFLGTNVDVVFIPDTVSELCDECFCRCERLRSVSFGASSKLERIGVQAFRETGIESLCIPDSVVELCDGCFRQCDWLECVTFGASSNIVRIGSMCFAESFLGEFEIPSSLVELGGGVFNSCDITREWFISHGRAYVVCGSLLLNRARNVCYGSVCDVMEIAIPYDVVELCDNCFCQCGSLTCVTFGSRHESCWRCLAWFRSLLSCIFTSSTFGASPRLERIGARAFYETSIKSLCIPDSVVELCDECFYRCERLRCVTFGVSSNLERIGARVFHKTTIESLCIPDSVVELCDK